VLDTIVSAAPDGRVTDVMCSMRGGTAPVEIESLCTCIQGKAGGWRFPAAHGKLGLLESGDVILTFTFRYR